VHSNYNVSWTQEKIGRKVANLTFEFKEKLLTTEGKQKKKTKTKTEAQVQKIENIDHFADMRKRFGEALPIGAIPEEIIEQLKSQGRW
jgi:plasmid replication initiation protein